MQCEECKNEKRIEQIERCIIENTSQHSIFFENIKNLEKTNERTDERYKNILKEIERMNETLNDLKNKPIRNWDTLIKCLITTIAGLAIGKIL